MILLDPVGDLCLFQLMTCCSYLMLNIGLDVVHDGMIHQAVW